MPEARCPICSRIVDGNIAARLRPFCSKRCADVDLGRWFTESYRVPTMEAEDGDEDPFDPPLFGMT